MPNGGFGLVFGLPEAPTILFVVALVIILSYLLLRAYSATLLREIDSLREAMGLQDDRHQRDLSDLNGKIAVLDSRYQEERSVKHKALNDVAKTVMALDLVQRLARECTCGVLSPLQEIIDGLVADLETTRRAGRP